MEDLGVGASWVNSSHLVPALGVSLTYPVPDVNVEDVVRVVAAKEVRMPMGSSEEPVALGFTPVQSVGSDMDTLASLSKQQGEILLMLKMFRMECLEMKSDLKQLSQRLDSLESAVGTSHEVSQVLGEQGHQWAVVDGEVVDSLDDDFEGKAGASLGGLDG